MPLFGPRLSREEQEKVKGFVREFNELNAWHADQFDSMAQELVDLFTACDLAQRSGADRLSRFGESDLEAAQAVLVDYQAHIDELTNELQSLPYEEWFSKKLRKSFEEITGFLETERRFLTGTVLEALSPPQPLVNQPGQAKLNMFVSGLNLMATMVRAFRRPVRA